MSTSHAPEPLTAASTQGLYIERGGVGLLFDLTPGRTPALLSWGPRLGLTTPEHVDAACLALQPPIANNTLEIPERLGLLPCPADGYLGAPGVSGSRPDGSGFAPRLECVEADGVGPHESNRSAAFSNSGKARAALSAQSAAALHSVRLEHNEDATLLVIPTADTAHKLTATIELELHNSGLVRGRATLTNTGETEYRVDAVRLAFPIPERARELLDFSGRWSREREPQRSTFGIGAHVRENFRGRTGADSAFVLSAGVPGFTFHSGEVWSIHAGFSGNHEHRAQHTASGAKTLSASELLLPGEIVLAPEGAYTTPWAFASYGEGLDATASRMHTWLRERPTYARTPRPVTLNVWEAVYFDQSLEKLTALADAAVRIGVERFVIDDGWFSSRRDDTRGLGDWTVSKELWPNGMQPLTDHVRALGMEVGLWFEPEMVNEDSDVARAHPEWIMAAHPDRLPPRSRHQQVLNLTIPEAFAHVHEQMRAIIRDLGVDYIKWDHNRDLIEAGDRTTGNARVHEQTLASYRLVTLLKEEFPHLHIESCSSGGSRIDLGMAELTDRVWASDCIDPHERANINQWTLQLLPPEMIGSHVASGRSHTTGRMHDLSFRAGVSALFSFGIEWDLTVASPEELDALANWITWHKSMRERVARGTVQRVELPGYRVYGVVDEEEALYCVAAVERHCHNVPGRLRLPVPHKGSAYAVSIECPGGLPSGYGPAGCYAHESGDADPVHGQHGTGSVGTSVDMGVLPGRFLSEVGIELPITHVDQCFILRLRAVEAPATAA